jgi:hypothetical protein
MKQSAITVMGLSLAMIAGVAFADDGGATPGPAPIATPTIAPEIAAPLRAPRRVGGSIMREGAFLVQARGSIARDDRSGWWILTVEDQRLPSAGLTFRALPNLKLSEIELAVRSLRDSSPRFEVTGEVFVFRGRNYLLISQAPLIGIEPVKGPSVGVDAPPTTPAPATSRDGAEEPRGDSADDIAAALEEAVGPAARSLSNDRPAPPMGVTPDRSNSGLPGATLTEGTRIDSRRGRLVRERSGEWSFVFDADASGRIDPAMTIAPCLLLERMQAYASGMDTTVGVAGPPAGVNAAAAGAMILSGQVLAYDGRNYLLPTVFRIPAERTPLSP